MLKSVPERLCRPPSRCSEEATSPQGHDSLIQAVLGQFANCDDRSVPGAATLDCAISAAVTLGTYATQRDLPLIQGLSNWVAEQANVVAALTKPAGDTKYGHQPAGRIPTNQ